MSERDYFSLRYAIPGYSFILVLIALNYMPIIYFLNESGLESVFGAFLAFFSLFSGSAIGFLVSQLHWWRFKCTSIVGLKEMRNLARRIYDNYIKNSKNKKETSDDEIEKRLDDIGIIFEYIIRTEEEKKFFRLAERRWDMYHLFSSTICSLVFGLVVGFLSRVFFEWFLFQPLHEFPSVDIMNFPVFENPEIITQLLTIFAVAFFSVILWKSKRNFMEKYCPLLTASIISSKLTRIDVETLFPEIKSSN